MTPGRSLLVVAPRFPNPLFSGERWILGLIRAHARRWRVVLLAPAERGFEKATAARALAYESELGCRIFLCARSGMRAQLKRLLAAERPDAVHFHFLETAPLLDLLPKTTPSVLTEHDASHFLSRGSYRPARFLGPDRRNARKFYHRASVVTVFSAQDARSVRLVAPAARTTKVPLTVGTDAFADSPPRPRSGRIVFVGNYLHRPNRDAAIRLARRILPIVRASRPDAELWLVGAKPTRSVRALENGAVTVTGMVDDVRKHLRAAQVTAVPTDLGGGVKGKILEAFAAGVPVVITPEAARGLGRDAAPAVLTARSDRDFARALLRLMSDANLRRLKAARGTIVAASRRDEDAATAFDGIYRRLIRERR